MNNSMLGSIRQDLRFIQHKLNQIHPGSEFNIDRVIEIQDTVNNIKKMLVLMPENQNSKKTE